MVVFCSFTGKAAAEEANASALAPAYTQSLAPKPASVDLRLPARDRWSGAWKWSAGALVTATALDAASSWGKQEANPFLRNGDGRFGQQAVLIKAGLAAGTLTMQYLMRKRGGSHRMYTIMNFVQAGAYSGIAVRNFGLPTGH